jgi:hypothetical protein
VSSLLFSLSLQISKKFQYPISKRRIFIVWLPKHPRKQQSSIPWRLLLLLSLSLTHSLTHTTSCLELWCFSVKTKHKSNNHTETPDCVSPHSLVTLSNHIQSHETKQKPVLLLNNPAKVFLCEISFLTHPNQFSSSSLIRQKQQMKYIQEKVYTNNNKCIPKKKRRSLIRNVVTSA